MIQRILNHLTIRVDEVDLLTMHDIEVTIEQKTTDTEFTYSGENVLVAGPHLLTVTVPKEDALLLDKRNARGQVMFTDANGVPRATEPFQIPVKELLKDDGYGE